MIAEKNGGLLDVCNYDYVEGIVTDGYDLYSKKHQKRLSAPSHWLLDKMSGTYAPKASPGPHKLRDCLPLIVFIRNRYDTIPIDNLELGWLTVVRL